MVDTFRDGETYGAFIKNAGDLVEARKLKNLTHLSIDLGGVRVDTEHRYAGPLLSTISLGNCIQPLTTLVDVKASKNLSKLIIGDSRDWLGDAMSESLCQSLTDLAVQRQELASEEREWIKKVESTVFLALWRTNVDDRLLVDLGCRRWLRLLYVGETGVELRPEVFPEFAFPSLRSLDISKTAAQLHSVEQFASMFPSLQRLIACDVDVSEDVLRAIGRLPGMKILHTGNPDIDFDRYGNRRWVT